MPGKFEQAQGGTIFLDEIGELKIELQAKILRVLQEFEVERIGSIKSISLNVRVLSASNIDMKTAIKAGDFREDLFYRLNVFPMKLLPLRERKKDIATIAEKLLQRHCGNNRVEPMISAPAMKLLLEYQWPGNIRELDNVIQRSLVLMSGDTIQKSDIFLDESSMINLPVADVVEEKNIDFQHEGLDLKQREAKIILETLKENNGHRQKTAEALNLSPRTLRYKLAKFKELGMDVS